MARLEYTITGDITGLASAADGVKGILNNLQAQADKLNLKLFGAETQADLQAIGGALTIVTGKINEYTTAAIQGSQAFKDQSAQSALDALATKINVLTGNAQLFGESIKNQQLQINAYQQALNKILAQGFDPLDQRITSIKANIDRLTASIETQKTAAKTYIDPFAKFQTTGSLIKDAESKVRNLSLALRDATSTRDIAQYNVRLTEAQKNLESLKNTGIQTAQTAVPLGKALNEAGETASNAFGKLGKGLTTGLGYLRTIAYIVPGIGLAGIFNLAFEGIAKAAEGLDLFTTKLDGAVDTLKNFNELQKEADKIAGTQIAPLKALYEAATDVTRSMKDRIQAAKELKDADFETFGSATNLAIANGDLKKSYDELTDSILKQAQAQAAVNKIGELSSKILDENYKQQKIKNAQANETAKLQKDIASGSFNLAGTGEAGGEGILQGTNQDQINQRAADAVKESKRLQKIYQDEINAFLPIAESSTKVSAALARANGLLGPNLEKFSSVLATAVKEGDLTQLQALENALKTKLDALAPGDSQIKNLRDKVQQVEDIIKNAYNVKPTKTAASSGLSDLSFNEQLTNILNSSNASANKSGKVGLDLDLQTIKDKYVKLYADLQNLDDKRDASSNISNQQRVADEAKSAQVDATLRLNEAKEVSDAIIKDEQRTAQEVQRIRDEFGVKSTQTRAREIAAINTLADSEIIKAEGNAAKLKAIDEGRTTAIQAVNDKYNLIVSQTYDKINDIVAQGNANQVDTETRKIAKINLQYDKLTQQVNKYYSDLKVLQAQGDASLKGRDLNAEQQNSDTQLQNAKQLQISIVLSAMFSKALQSSIDTFANDFYSSIVGLGKAREDIDTKYAIQLANATDQSSKDQISKLKALEQATTTSFGAIFSSLTGKFNQTFSQSIVQSFVKKLTDGLGETLITPSLTKIDPAISISNAGVTFAQTIVAAGQAFASAATGGAFVTGDILEGAGKTTEKAVTTGGNNAHTGLSKGAAQLAAAASVIGGVVSGLGKPTNSVTSGLGGAISGAGEGALIGSAIAPGVGTVVGAVAGGLIGLVGGLFSASKARKELQQQQLEQEQQQTALLRQQVAYTTSIVGRVTSQGVVTNVGVGAFGQLTATVSGRDLQFVLDRNANGR